MHPFGRQVIGSCGNHDREGGPAPLLADDVHRAAMLADKFLHERQADSSPFVRARPGARNAVKPVEVGAHLLRVICKRHTAEWQWKPSVDRLFGSDRLRLAVEREGGIEALLPVIAKESEQFRAQAEKYWIYK